MPVSPTLSGSNLPSEDLPRTLSVYARSNSRKAIIQVVDTFLPFLFLWALMLWMAGEGISYWLILVVAVLTAGFQVRIFILFHDCCHGSFFESKRANRILGYIAGIVNFTPFEQWRRAHAIHHETVGDLDRRGVGDIWLLTVEEYLTSPRWKQIAYRIVRNPAAILLLGPFIVFLVTQRFFRTTDHRRERISVVVTDIAIALVIVAASLTVGFWTYVLIQGPVMLVAGAAGIWLFYVQHQYDGVYWARHAEWNRLRAATQGSSYYQLPRVLRWFTGDIGLHHLHHVHDRIPNYTLHRCFDDVPELQQVKPLTLRGSLKCMKLNLWDEKNEKLVSFGSLRRA